MSVEGEPSVVDEPEDKARFCVYCESGLLVVNSIVVMFLEEIKNKETCC